MTTQSAQLTAEMLDVLKQTYAAMEDGSIDGDYGIAYRISSVIKKAESSDSLLDPDLRHQKMMEQTQKALDLANRALYESKKERSDQHLSSCHCEVCDWVEDYEYEQSRLHPAAEPNYCQE